MGKKRKLEKLVLATILAGSMALCPSALAGTSDFDISHRGPATPLDCTFDGKLFINANVYANPGGYISEGDEPEDKYELRDFLDSSEKDALSLGIRYWYDVLGTPKTIPNVDIYLIDKKDSNASANSDFDSESGLTMLAKCFQESFKKDSDADDAIITVDLMKDSSKQWYTDNLGILPTNGTDADYPGTIVHEMFHALGIMRSDERIFSEESSTSKVIPMEQDELNLYEKHLYDVNGKALSSAKQVAIVKGKDEATDANTFYVMQNSVDHGDEDYRYGGIYFKGQHVDEVLKLEGKQAFIDWPNDNNKLEPVPGIPINSVERTDGNLALEISHFELQNSLQSHQNYRNWCVPMEVELAALEDLGYTIDRRKLYGNSVYNSGIDYVNNNPFYERKDGKYIEGAPSTQSLAIGFHVYGSDNKLLQKSNLLADGDNSLGIRVDGVNNVLTVDKSSTVTANGLNGRGINFAYGKNHELNVEGTVTALGAGGKALAFDFGDNELSNAEEYRGSYIRIKVSEDEDNNKFVNDLLTEQEPDYKLSALTGPLVNNVNISGSVAGTNAAIYVSSNAYVKNINVLSGAQLEGAILSDWSPTGIPGLMGSYVDEEGKKVNLDLASENIHLPEGENGLTNLNFEGDNIAYEGNIGSSLLEYGSIIMNVSSGTLNYEGTAAVDSVNVSEAAVLQGGTFKLDKEGIHRAEGDKEDNGKLINRGMISAALPKDENTVLSIEGDVVNAGGSMALIANGNYVGVIKIDGQLSGDTENTLAVNPNGSYLPGDTFDVSNLVTFADGEAVEFTAALPYETAMLKAIYGEDYKTISFEAENKLNSEDSEVNAAFKEMNNLARAVSASKNQSWQEKLGKLYTFDGNKAAKALKSIKGRASADASYVMQQSNLVRNTLGMRLSEVNRAKTAKLNVPVKQLTEGELIKLPVEVTLQPEYDLWAKVSHTKGAVNADSDYKTEAYSIGWDKRVSKDWRFGFFGSYGKGKFEADTIYNGLKDYRVGAYGGYNRGAAEAVVFADYGWGKNKLNRSLSTLDATTRAKYDSNIMELGVEYKYDLQYDKNKTWQVAPYGYLGVNRYSQKAYGEKGAEPFNKQVTKLNNTYAGVETGVDLERRFANGSTYGMRFGYRRGLTGVEPKQSYHYAADPEHRYINYGEGDRNKLVVRLNGQVQTAPNWSISGEASYERGKKGHGYSGEISLKYTW